MSVDRRASTRRVRASPALAPLLFTLALLTATTALAADDLARARHPASGCCTLLIAGVMFWLLKKTDIPNWLAAGIAIFPLGFAWFTLKDDFRAARTLAFGYLVIPICLVGSLGAYVGFMASRSASANERAGFPAHLREKCLATGAFTADECGCMEREARATAPNPGDEAASRAWVTATAHKCAPSANADPLGGPVSGTQVGIVPAKVRSLPEGAAVFVDGRPTGKTTPAEVELLSGTKATVEVRLEGYLPQEREVRYRVGDPAELTFRLDAAAALAVKTEPSGARVSVQGAVVIPHTPGEAKGLVPEPAKVAIQRAGHVTVVRDVVLEPGRTASLEEALVPAAYVTVTSVPEAATVEVDGVVMPERTPTPVPVLPNAKHTVVVSLPERTPVKKLLKSGAAGTTIAFSVTLVDAKLEALTRARDAAEKAQAKAELALEKARAKHDDAEARGVVTTKQVRALEQAEDAYHRAEDRADEAAAALDAYREQREVKRVR